MKQIYGANLERDWNYSQGTLARIDRRGEDCDTFAIEGEFYKLYRALRVLYVNVLWKIDKKKEEYETTTDAINKIFKDVKALLTSDNSKMNMFLIEEKMFNIRNEINIILFKEKLSYLETEKKSFEEEIEEDYR